VVVCRKKLHHCMPEELVAGDCWIALSLAQLNGLILSGRVGKHTDSLAIELVASTEGNSSCKEWGTDSWQGYGRVLPSEVDHYISKLLTQRLERTNGILRQHTRRWHRRQNMRDCGRNPSPRNSRKFAKVWELSDSYLAFGHLLLQLDLGTFSCAELRRLNEQT
jgi:IS1 family transposase